MLIHLPPEDLLLICLQLSAPDVLNLLCSHPTLHLLSQSRSFWDSLTKQHFQGATVSGSTNQDMAIEGRDNNEQQEDYQRSKQAYLLRAHCHFMPRLRWHHVETNISDREGHMACRLGNYLVVTGGFVEDNLVHVKRLDVADAPWRGLVPGGVGLPPGRWGVLPQWAYGSSLTPLDEHRAIRYGGFRQGGYSTATYQTSILHLNEDPNTGEVSCRWQICVTKLPSGAIVPEQDVEWGQLAARAYHCATLLFGRYLLIVGGMQDDSSILSPLILDVDTWTWYYDNVTTSDEAPSPRHGASMVFDEYRNRLLLFGGGNGSDLLRSGEDNSEVWELDINACSPADDLELTLPWVWNQLHQDQMNRDERAADNGQSDNNSNNTSSMDIDARHNPNILRPSEALNLGRCHCCHQVGRDSVLFLFGSGRPTCNSVLGYDLARDSFFRPNVTAPLPRGRFTAASIFLAELGYIFVQGGFSIQGEAPGTVSDSVVLDLAGGLQRNFELLPIRQDAPGFPPIDDEHAMNRPAVGGGGTIMEVLIGELLGYPDDQRTVRAATMLEYLQRTQRLGGQPAMFLALIASGQVRMMPDGNIQQVQRAEADDDTEGYE